jgi:hypothetical protein
MNIEPIFDQSVFVRAAVKGVEHEILLVGGLVATVVLVFLGSWRSTLIVLTSIPLALLCSIIGLNLAGATFNLMTLGGLALAIGILVDNALVEIENIRRQVSLGKDVRTAILDGARDGGRLPSAGARRRLCHARELLAGPHARADARVDHSPRRDWRGRTNGPYRPARTRAGAPGDRAWA